MTFPNKSHVVAITVGVSALLFLVSVPLWGTSYLKRVVVEFLYFFSLAQVWNFMAGYGGVVSIGQQAWVGVGAYALIVFAEDLGINPFLAVPLAGLVALILAAPTSWLLFRLKGAYFAVATWVIAEAMRLLVTANIDWLGGGRGRALRSVTSYARQTREDLSYWLGVGIALGVFLLIYGLLRSKIGLALMAMRDSEHGASGVGVSNRNTRRLLYLLATGTAGAIGALIYLISINVRPDSAFSINWSAYIIFIVVIGGLGSIEGPIIGTIIFFLLRQFLSGYEAWSLLIFGGVAIVVMLVAPRGIWGLVSPAGRFDVFSVRRRMPMRFRADSEPPQTEDSEPQKTVSTLTR